MPRAAAGAGRAGGAEAARGVAAATGVLVDFDFGGASFFFFGMFAERLMNLALDHKRLLVIEPRAAPVPSLYCSENRYKSILYTQDLHKDFHVPHRNLTGIFGQNRPGICYSLNHGR